MFTGLVKSIGKIRDVIPFGKGRRFRIDIGGLAAEAGVGQSVAVNGACLTITSLNGSEATFDAVAETVARTNLGELRPRDAVNLEPALRAGDALDGHIVLGHVDALALVLSIDDAHHDNRIVTIELPAGIRRLVAEKGSVAVDGISLTVARTGKDWFSVSIIPHSWENSTLSLLKVGSGVNLEADVMARYAARILDFPSSPEGGIDVNFLRKNGFA